MFVLGSSLIKNSNLKAKPVSNALTTKSLLSKQSYYTKNEKLSTSVLHVTVII